MKQHKYRITSTHNPQDFYNGIEPAELARSYTTCDLQADVDHELEDGYQVIVTKADGE